tara:strand:- start:4945 stop:5226 length:282 start_codon:yes stop_codon:yes gene_type:complete
MSISESKIEARTALICAFQKDDAGCVEEWALYKCACDVLDGEDIVKVCSHQPVTTMQVEQCIQTQRRRAIIELTAEMVARIRKENEDKQNEQL